jgi:uncharacterized membrane protein YraQ (UPF0718 family)
MIEVLVTLLVVICTGFLISLFLKKKTKKNALHPEEWKSLPLIEKTALSHDVQLFRFKMPDGVALGLPIGQVLYHFH